MSDKLDIEELYGAIHKAVGRLITCQVFVISLLDIEHQELEHVYLFDRGVRWPNKRAKVGQGLIGYALANGISLRVDDMSAIDPAQFVPIRFGEENTPTYSALVAMMRRGGKIIGAISTQAYLKNSYTDDDLRTLELLAAHTAIVLNNVSYYQEAVRDAQRRTTLYQASQRMSDKLDLEELYLTVHDSISRLMPCEAFIISLQTTPDQLDHVYIFDQGQRLPPETSPAKEGMIGYAIASGESLRVDELQKVDPQKFTVVQIGDDSHLTHSALVALMRRGGKSIGAISTQSYQHNAYLDADLRLLELLAAQAAIVIDNARLFARTQRYAMIDELTNIYNRRYLMEHAQTEFDRAKAEKTVLALVMFDVDFFKRVNDTYGHLIGDQLLQNICLACQKHLRSTDIFGRFGGEEFVVVLPDTTLLGAQRIAERLRQATAQAKVFSKTQGEIYATVSFGAAELTRALSVLDEPTAQEFTIDNLIDQADRALYAAKRGGRNRVCLYPDDVNE